MSFWILTPSHAVSHGVSILSKARNPRVPLVALDYHEDLYGLLVPSNGGYSEFVRWLR
jgi:hypothetical protein